MTLTAQTVSPRQTAAAQQAEQAAVYRQFLIGQGDLYGYQVIELRTTLIGDRTNGGDLALTLDQAASQGWRVKSIQRVPVKGRVGPGGTDGLIAILERRVYA